ncbi:mobile element protein [Streptomyces sp. NPDC051555]|uniref:mobile element protein n=1 Tax=Streptomyces sp. NPDC051555 TaxID=3365657 RepID=UPI00378BC0B4
MATDAPLADPAELATWLRVPADDPLLLATLRSASRRFRGAVRHEVNLVEGDEITLDGNGRESLLLPVWPTTAVTVVLLDDEELVEGTDYSWSEAGILRRLGCQVWPDRLRCVEVTYSHGWAEIPADISDAVIEQARAAFRSEPGVKSKAVGGQSVTFETGVTSQWSEAVQRHQVQTGSSA